MDKSADMPLELARKSAGTSKSAEDVVWSTHYGVDLSHSLTWCEGTGLGVAGERATLQRVPWGYTLTLRSITSLLLHTYLLKREFTYKRSLSFSN